MGILEVGKPFLPGRSYYPEGAQFALDGGGATLLLFLSSPTEGEERDIRQGSLTLGLLPIPPALFLPFRFGRMPWSEATFTPHLLSPKGREGLKRLYELSFASGEGLLLQVILVGARSGIVRGLRALGLPTKLSEDLLKEVKHLEESPWPGEAAYRRHIDSIYARFSSEELARHAEIYRVP